MSNQPKSKPQITRAEVEKYLSANGVDLKKEKMALVAIRTLVSGKAKTGIFDDRLIWLDEKDMASFEGNVDPSRYKTNVATLKPGVWRYKKGNHGSKAYGPYPAFRQAAPVTVLRYVDGKTWKPDTGMFGINVHHGSKSGNSTSSLGCLTIPYSNWAGFKSYGDMLIARHGLKDFCLVVALQSEEAVAPVAQDSFDFAFKFVLGNEGGYSNHKNDKGGPTNWGIIQREYSKWLKRPASIDDVKSMTKDTARAIYKAWYWDVNNLDQVKDTKVATAIFDQGVNRGTGTIARAVQKIVKVSVDGEIGPKSLAAINARDPKALINAIADNAEAAYKAIVARDSSQKVFLKGWLNRAAHVRSLA